MTREQAVILVKNQPEKVDLVLQYRLDEFRRLLTSTGSDSGEDFIPFWVTSGRTVKARPNFVDSLGVYPLFGCMNSFRLVQVIFN